MNPKTYILTPAPQVTARSSATTVEIPQIRMPSGLIMKNLSKSIGEHQLKMDQFQKLIESSINTNEMMNCKCRAMLNVSVGQLKEKFKEFANQWKVQLPLICQQFMEIVTKICKLYQQELERLAENNSKWQFSYQQLLKATNLASTSFVSLSSKIESEWTQKLQPKLLSQLENGQTKTTMGQKLEQMPKLKDYQISLMREQITELFEEENSAYEKELTQEIKNCRVHHKAVTQTEKVLEEVKQFRLKTVSDEQINLAQGNSKNNSNFSSKSSYQNSRKNSIVFKQQFWNSLCSTGKLGKLNKSVQPGKENINIPGKQRLSVPQAQMKQNAKQQRPSHSSTSSKLQQLRKNMYKNKNTCEGKIIA